MIIAQLELFFVFICLIRITAYCAFYSGIGLQLTHISTEFITLPVFDELTTEFSPFFQIYIFFGILNFLPTLSKKKYLSTIFPIFLRHFPLVSPQYSLIFIISYDSCLDIHFLIGNRNITQFHLHWVYNTTAHLFSFQRQYKLFSFFLHQINSDYKNKNKADFMSIPFQFTILHNIYTQLKQMKRKRVVAFFSSSM